MQLLQQLPAGAGTPINALSRAAIAAAGYREVR